MPFPKAIATKPYLITEADYREVGQNITLVGEDELAKKIDSASGYASPMLMNWVEPYPVSGTNMTMFYTEVSSGMKEGDKVFIIGGPYDSAKLIEIDKYKKGRDGYRVLKVDGCRIALDIPFSGEMPYREDLLDDFIKVYYIDTRESFVAANRQMTTRGGQLGYKFGYGQGSIAFFADNFEPIEEWGRNGGVSGAPGFFVREENSYLGSVSMKEQWNNITDKLIYLGSFSVAGSEEWSNNGRLMIMNSSFEYGGQEFREGTAYRWNAKKNRWVADVEYSRPVISRSSFRSGRFEGKFNAGSYGTAEKQISWTGNGIWNGGTIINAKWKSGTMGSKISLSSTMRAEKDQYGIPFQKPVAANNEGFGFNFAIGCDIQNSLIENGSFYRTSFSGTGTNSVVEQHLLGITQSYENRIAKAFFDGCEFRRVSVLSGEIKNARVFDSRIDNVKSINSYYVRSVVKDSTYIGDGVIKILGYDEWSMSEYRSRESGTYSYINSPNCKIYKFYISKESFNRLKSKDYFYIKGMKIKDRSNDVLLDFFDSKFSISSWSAYFDDISTGDPSITGVAKNSFYKRGYEISAFLSTPEENSHVIGSFEEEYQNSGSTRRRFGTGIVSENPKKGYSIDIVAARHDIFNKSIDLQSSTDRYAPIPRDYNYGSDISIGKASMPNKLGEYVDFSAAYIIDADFSSGILETTDWNSGYHINYNNDLALGGPTSTGIYSIYFDEGSDRIVVDTPYKDMFWENGTEGGLEKGDIVFIGGLDYDNRGMISTITLVATGSSYSSAGSSDPAYLVNTAISGITMSNSGRGYFTDSNAATVARTGSGTGLKLSIQSMSIGSVISITYSPSEMASGGSYSVSFGANIPGYSGQGPVPTASFVDTIVTDSNGSITGVPGATYTVFGPPLTTAPSSAYANAIFATGPANSGSGLLLKYSTLADGSISDLIVESPGIGYSEEQVFYVEGGSATFSIESISKGEILSYSIAEYGEDYRIGDIIDVSIPFRPNFSFDGATASFVVQSITVSYYDKKGAAFEITAGSEGEIIGITMSLPGREYRSGEIFAIGGGNMDAIVRIDSVTGSISRLPDAYRVEENRNGKISLSEVGTQSVIAGLTGGGVFYTSGASNRWGHMSKSKIDRSKIKSGVFRRPYITRSLIKNSSYSSNDKDFQDISRIKSLMVADSLFSSNGNILSSATYMHSVLCGGSDLWNDGIAYMSILSGMTFSSGTVKSSAWLGGSFTGGTFYSSRSFDAKPSIFERNYLSNSLWLYYMKGEVNADPKSTPSYNGRFAWHDGIFSGGEFYKSDWNAGTFSGGLFHDSKFYSGSITGGLIGSKGVAAEDTRIYNGTIFNTTVNNAYVYSEDTSYEGLSSSNIQWMDGTFNGGVFGSNNKKVMGYTESSVSFSAGVTALPIKDFKITLATASVPSTMTDPMSADFEIDVEITLKHTYIGDLIINLMAPNGNIINLKKKYSGGSSDNMISSVFTSDADAPSIDIWTSPYTGTFKMERLIGQGVYYNLLGNAVRAPYVIPKKDLPPIKTYTSAIPSQAYDGDRYLVVATASDPTWSPSQTLFPASFIGKIVEYKSSTSQWIYPTEEGSIDLPDYGDRVVTQSGESLIFLQSSWLKSYHANIYRPSDLLNSDRTVIGNWRILIMDDAGIDSGFLDDFSITFRYRDSYLIRQYKNDATWNDGIFNGGQFVDLGIWKNGKFNGGKFISTYGWESSGSYLGISAPKGDYTWQGGEFNGGEFGNGSLGANSTWYTGAFSGGTFKGRLWNDGIFMYGEFKGGSVLPAIGGSKSSSAQIFVDQFRNGEFRGLWRKGIVSEKKEDFIKDSTFPQERARATKPVQKDKYAKFDSMLWMGGIFGHQTGEMVNSVWMDGLFRNGKMTSSSFNPYVTRMGDSREFVKDDSSIWENGTFLEGEFFYSKWMQGNFISGTATGMVWKNGIASYMNAYNVFWEAGLWKNGNWNGSSFEYTGKVEDGFAREILNRGIEWSGTSSCHIWNLFESDSDRTNKIVKSLISPEVRDESAGITEDSFATDNLDDAGIDPPFFRNSDLGLSPNSYVPQSETEIRFNITVNKGGGPLARLLVAYTSSPNFDGASEPFVSISSDSASTISPSADTQYIEYSVPSDFVESSVQVSITGLNANIYYNFKAYASNIGGGTRFTATKKNVRTILPITSVASQTPSPTTPHPQNGYLTITTSFSDPNQNTGTRTAGIYISESSSSNLTQNGPGVRLYASQLISTSTFQVKIPYLELDGYKTYYFRPWIQNGYGVSRSDNQYSFTTGAISPAITNFSDPGTATPISTLSMSIQNKGSATIKYGFILGTSPISQQAKSSSIFVQNPDANGKIGSFAEIFLQGSTTTQNGSTVNISITNTVPGQIYHVVAYVVDTAYATLSSISAQYQLKTAYTVPSVSTSAPIVGQPSVTLQGNITGDGGSALTYRGFIYRKDGSLYPALTINPITNITNNASGTIVEGGNSTGIFTYVISTLLPGQKYYFKSFAINSVGINQGQDVEFTTLATVTVATRTNGWSSGLPSLSALLNTTNNGSNISQGIYVSSNNTPTANNAATTLTANTKYYVRPYVTNAGGTSYGAIEEAYTLSNVKTLAPSTSSIGIAGFVAKVNLPANADAKGVVWYVAPSGPKTPVTTTQTGDVDIAISGLASGTRYVYEAFADAPTLVSNWNVNVEGVSGAQRTYSTLLDSNDKKEVWTLAEITSNVSASYLAGVLKLTGVSITNTGGSQITEYGMIWTAMSGQVPPDPTNTSSGAVDIKRIQYASNLATISIGDISDNTAISTNTTIKVRPYVVNNGGTFLGAIRTIVLGTSPST